MKTCVNLIQTDETKFKQTRFLIRVELMNEFAYRKRICLFSGIILFILYCMIYHFVNLILFGDRYIYMVSQLLKKNDWNDFNIS